MENDHTNTFWTKMNREALIVTNVWRKYLIMHFVNQIELDLTGLKPLTLHAWWELIWT